jgi:light-regulated signal transduction histidine kinase (bacteriophytochrome)
VSTRGSAFAAVDLNETVRDVLSDLEVCVRETKAEVDVGHLPTVRADATQMRQLLQNLIGNALKFHKDGEPPRVKVDAEVPGSRPASAEGSPPPFCRLTVEDNGIGFDPQYAERIFGLFQRLHRRQEYSGSGIGLAVCRRIVERHGGTITAGSKPGEGARFVATLPLARAAVQTEG